MNIAIDGPSGAGKSTIAKLLSKRLNIVYLDTGAMYRAIGLKVFESGILPDDENAINNILQDTIVDVVYKDGNQIVMLDGHDVSEKIRLHHISKYASDVSKIKNVRLKMVELQRQISAKGDTVLDGRDIGTYVLPLAKLKIFLTADVDERARRRYDELCAKDGEKPDFETVKKDIQQRDYNDSHRDFAPLKKADDAIEIDTTGKSIDEVVNIILSLIK